MKNINHTLLYQEIGFAGRSIPKDFTLERSDHVFYGDQGEEIAVGRLTIIPPPKSKKRVGGHRIFITCPCGVKIATPKYGLHSQTERHRRYLKKVS